INGRGAAAIAAQKVVNPENHQKHAANPRDCQQAHIDCPSPKAATSTIPIVFEMLLIRSSSVSSRPLTGRLANFISRSRAASATNRAVFGGRRPAAQLADASGGS